MPKHELRFDDLFGKEAEEAYAAYQKVKKLRQGRPWVRDIIRVLWNYRSGTSMQRLTDELWAMRKPLELPMPRAFKKTVQSFLNQHTSQSSQWNKKPEDDLFYSPKGKGSGTWAVHQDRAAAWLKNRQLSAA
jgi:hypothetical protein